LLFDSLWELFYNYYSVSFHKMILVPVIVLLHLRLMIFLLHVTTFTKITLPLLTLLPLLLMLMLIVINIRGVARNLFWGVYVFLGGIKLLNSRSDVTFTP